MKFFTLPSKLDKRESLSHRPPDETVTNTLQELREKQFVIIPFTDKGDLKITKPY